jgi:2-polyprenyl-6-hydroxyphenyl methylase/3-demethylubiquinone-9 3-methyltransferase
MPNNAPSSTYPDEIAKFNDLAARWWDVDGPMAPLHRMNPTRLKFIAGTLNNHFKDLKKLNILDIGCGGGMVSEPLARLGATVTGIDGAEELIRIAQDHAKAEKLKIDYRAVLTDKLLAERKTYDAILALEVLEHVPDPSEFVSQISRLLKPGGMVIFSTLSRTVKSMALGVVAAEYILRWLPIGTHDWQKFIKPSELFTMCQEAKLNPVQTMGLVYHPLTEEFALDENDLGVNYFLVARKADKK